MAKVVFLIVKKYNFGDGFGEPSPMFVYSTRKKADAACSNLNFSSLQQKKKYNLHFDELFEVVELMMY